MEKLQAAPEAKAQPSERRVSETDPEARLMKESNGGSGLCHNVQVSTDAAQQIIVAASVTQACNDQHEMVPAIAEIERQTGNPPQRLVVDDGYTRRENILEATVLGVDLIGGSMEPNPQAVARQLAKRGVDPGYFPDQFAHHAHTDTCTCPQGKTLWLKEKLGMWKFGVRGLQKVRSEVLWACLAYNIQQWFRLRWKDRRQPVEA
jgi:hypothetical protein